MGTVEDFHSLSQSSCPPGPRADLVAITLKYIEFTGNPLLLILFNLALAAVFFFLAKERGERYIKALFEGSAS
jgi:hypothetical protein